MLDWSRTLDSSGLFHLVRLCDLFDLDPDPLLAEVGLPPRRDLSIETPVTGVDELLLLRALQRELPTREDLGMVKVATRVNPATHLTMLLASAPNLAEALELNRRFLALTWAMIDFEVTEDHEFLTITFDTAGFPRDALPYHLQRNAAALRAWTRTLGYQGPIIASFPFAAPREPEQVAAYHELLGTRPHFGASSARLRFPRALAAQPQPGASPETLRILLADSERRLALHQARAGASSQVRALIRISLPERLSLEDVAQHLLVAPRTLRRQLTAEGTTFRQVMDEVLSGLAADTLLLRDVSVQDVANELGYSTSSAFIAAFARWYDCSPTQYRQRHSSAS